MADATLIQANPVSGTPYAVLATTNNVRIYGIMAYCEWTVQPTPLELHITIDGNTITHTQTDPVSGTGYLGTRNMDQVETNQGFVTDRETAQRPAFLWEGKSVSITAEVTGGTVQSLQARVKYGRW